MIQDLTESLRSQLLVALAECERLRHENASLRVLLAEHGIATAPTSSCSSSESDSAVAPADPPKTGSRVLATTEKIALFRSLFRGRTDIYPLRWESKAGKSGYSPACGNERRTGVCDKPRIKCADCGHRLLLAVTDQVIYEHLAGHTTVGVYPLLPDETCYFLAVDFDEATWKDDAAAFMQSCRELEVPAVLEISRSGRGAHAWIFFSSAVPYRRGTPAVWEQPSFPTLASELASCNWRPTIDCFRTKIRCRKAGSAT